MGIAKDIRAIRKANGLTQIQMAGLCRRQSKTLSKYETGAKKRPDAAWLRWYVKAFGKGRKYPSIDGYLRSRTIKTATADELAYLYHSQELNLREIGELYACHHGTVRRYMLRLNVPTLKTRRKSPFRWRVEYQGVSYTAKTLSELQAVWGVNRSTIHKQVQKFGAFCNGRLKITRNVFTDESEDICHEVNKAYPVDSHTDPPLGRTEAGIPEAESVNQFPDSDLYRRRTGYASH